MMSPIALMRVTRIRFHWGWARKELFSQNLSARVIFRIADNFHASAAFNDHGAFRDSFRSVIGALGVDIGTNLADQRTHIRLRKNHHRIHIAERCQYFGALCLGSVRTAFALQSPRGCIGVQANNDFCAACQFLGGAQITHMTYVQQIEATVGEHNAIAGCAPFRHLFLELLPAANFAVAHDSVFWMASSSSCRETVAVPRFITTMPPATLANRAADSASAPAARAAVKTAITVSPAPVTSVTWSEPNIGISAGFLSRLQPTRPP